MAHIACSSLRSQLGRGVVLPWKLLISIASCTQELKYELRLICSLSATILLYPRNRSVHCRIVNTFRTYNRLLFVDSWSNTSSIITCIEAASVDILLRGKTSFELRSPMAAQPNTEFDSVGAYCIIGYLLTRPILVTTYHSSQVIADIANN